MMLSTPPTQAPSNFDSSGGGSSRGDNSESSNGLGPSTPNSHSLLSDSSSPATTTDGSASIAMSPSSAINGTNGGKHDKKWKQMFKFGSIGKRTTSGGSGSGGRPNQEGLQDAPLSAPPIGSSADRKASGRQTSANFQPISGSTVVADPNSLSNDSQSFDGGHDISQQADSSFGSSGQSQREGRLGASPSKLQPAAEVGIAGAGGLDAPPQLTLTGLSNGSTTSTASSNGSRDMTSFASKLLRRASSAPDANKLFLEEQSNGTSGEPAKYLSPSTQVQLQQQQQQILQDPEQQHLGHQQFVSEGATHIKPQDPFFPGSPVRMDSNARSFSSKDFEKARSGSKSSGGSGNSTPKGRGGITFPGSRSKSHGSAKSNVILTPNGEKKRDQLALPASVPSSASNLATLQPPTTPEGGSSPHRNSFRRTYSSNSIKVRQVEVGPNSFSKVKMLGKGDVGKVYLVREKKTEKLFAMKGEHHL